jgi:hypothetical protein
VEDVAHEKRALASHIPHANNRSSSSDIPRGWKAALQGAFDQAAIGAPVTILARHVRIVGIASTAPKKVVSAASASNKGC